MDIKNVFSVDTVNMKKLFADEREKCFYIPAYQRPYSWKKDDINRMWEDIVYGLEQLGSSEDYITFLGSVITMHDTKHQSIAPIVRGETPTKVMVIIDGQQRLTTMLLLVISLDNTIRRKLTKDNETALSRVLDTLTFVSDMYKSPKSYGLNKSKDYPKIIRAYDDKWSTDTQEQYNSPIARLLKEYIDFVADDKNKRKTFVYSANNAGEDTESHKGIKFNLDVFKKSIASFLKDKSCIHKIMVDHSDLLDIEESIFFGQNGCGGIHESISENKDQKEIFILILILRFVLQRVFVADIVAKKEEYAFEMFDSLNTTGDPLTAFETFKPKVVEHIGLEKYFDSKSKKYMEQIEDYLKLDPKRRDTATNQLITTFSLSENGSALSKKLREQRIYLRDEYKKTNGKEDFVKNLATVSKFYNIWNLSNKNSDEIIINELKDDKVALTCLQFLAKKHTISIALLSRFYSKSLLENSDAIDFREAIKVIAAFFVLWRSARTGTAGIDNCYRKLMSKGIENPRIRGIDGVEQGQNKIPPFCRQKDIDGISLETLKKAFRYFLFKGATDKIEIYSKETWLSKIKNINIYNVSQEVCKLMLISAFDGVVSSNQGIGLVEEARSGISETLNKGFDYSFFQSIEHISPQTNNWNGVSDERKHTLGNLTLLPKSINSSASNRALKEKELMFKALSAETLSEQSTHLKDSNVKFGESTESILAQSQHFPYLKSLDNLEGWNDEVIEARTENLGSIIWGKLAIEWLGFEK
ncbi:hypothetical protein [uncultured Gammaproteobacteria bacterium]|nr:hypothetical protein [uncultured Gammaproteobacteria bacterium]CAC9969063.1 hypothetical protein [uncultured Gammaproteobacteria bacterium]